MDKPTPQPQNKIPLYHLPMKNNIQQIMERQLARFEKKFGKEQLHEQDGTEYDFKEEGVYKEIKSFFIASQQELVKALIEEIENARESSDLRDKLISTLQDTLIPPTNE